MRFGGLGAGNSQHCIISLAGRIRGWMTYLKLVGTVILCPKGGSPKSSK